MSQVFIIALAVMAIIALTFVGQPVLKSDRRSPILIAVVAVPILAAILYMSIGSPDSSSVSPAHSSTAGGSSPASPMSSGKTADSVANLVGGLAARLNENPEDAKSWLLLAKSYRHLNRMPEAADAYNRAEALGEVDAELAQLLKGRSSTPVSTATISGSVALSRKASETVLPTDTVFIFARAVDGPKMPLAVVQQPASKLPLEFSLDDSQSMIGDVKLSNYDAVVVTARVSRSGIATEALQGLEAKSDVVRPSDHEQIALIIE